jgi:HD-like signal output (HDOD) protein
MGIVRIHDLQTDMILADDVLDINSRFLLSKGAKIESQHIRIFKMWGIAEVNVQGDGNNDEPSAPVVDPEFMEEIKENTKYIFKHTDLNHPAVREIFRLAVKFRTQRKISVPIKNINLHPCEDLNKIFVTDLRQKISRNELILPEIPSIVYELNEVIADPFASADDIAQIVSKSPSLTAILLKIVNSAFYGFPAPIDSISRAVIMIGTKEISSLALGICTIKIFKDIPNALIDMKLFLQHSLTCGIVSRILAATMNIPQTEQLFISGLLHDLGRLIVYKYYPDLAKSILNRVIKSENLLYKEENLFFGCNHTHLGRYLLKQWRLPLILENNIFYHHQPSRADSPILPTIVHLADIIVNALGIGNSGESFVPSLDETAWDSLLLSPACFENVVEQAIHQFNALKLHMNI